MPGLQFGQETSFANNVPADFDAHSGDVGEIGKCARAFRWSSAQKI